MSMPELREQLSSIEPDESTYAGLGPGDVPQLVALLADDEAWMAARAVYALARIRSSQARAALLKAAAYPRAEVRVALASVAPDLPGHASDSLLEQLLGDPDAGVRKFAIRSVSERNGPAVRAQLRKVAVEEEVPQLRALAERVSKDLEK
jgi:HEAT repeat protein